MSAASAAPCDYKGYPLRHRRPPLLLEVEGGRRPLERDPARRLHRAAAPVAHLLRRQVLRLSAARPSRRCASSASSTSAACVLSYACRPRRSRSRSPQTFHDWVRNQFGERLFSIFFKTYTEKVWGMSCEEISADWAAQRIKGLDLGVAVRRTRCSARSACGKPQAAATAVKTLIETLPLSAQGPRHDVGGGARARSRRRAASIQHGPRADAPALRRQAAGCGRVDASTTRRRAETLSRRATSSPRRRSASWSSAITPDADRRCQRAATLRYRDFLTVVLIVNKPDVFPDNWIYIHDPSVKVGRIQNFKSWSPEMVPDPTHDLPRPRILLLRGRRPVDLCRRRADRARPSARSRKIGLVDGRRRGRRLRGAPAQGLSGLRRRLPRQRRRRSATSSSASYPTLHLVGRNGMHKYNNQDHAMMTGDADGAEHPGRRALLRPVAGQRGRRIPRGRSVRRRGGAAQRASGAAQSRHTGGVEGRPAGPACVRPEFLPAGSSRCRRGSAASWRRPWRRPPARGAGCGRRSCSHLAQPARQGPG